MTSEEKIEILKKIKDVEREADKAIQRAEKEKKEIIANAKNEARITLEDAEEEAEKVKAEIIANAKSSINQERSKLKEKWKEKIFEIENRGKRKTEEAVDFLYTEFFRTIKSVSTSWTKTEPERKQIQEEPQEGAEIGEGSTPRELENKSRRPKAKGIPTEKKKRGRTTTKTRKTTYRGKKDLGQKSSRKKSFDSSEQETREETTDFPEEEITSTRIKSPLVEIDLDEAKVFLVLPEQQLVDMDLISSKQVSYRVNVNSRELSVPVTLYKDSQDNVIKTVEERIELEKPLEYFKVNFPNEIESREFEYNHFDDDIYVFVPRGDTKAKIHYLFNSKESINPLPNRNLWILLKENLEVEIEPNLVEQTWIWDRYQPLNINLKGESELILKDPRDGQEKSYPCMAFSMDGEIVEDDYKDLFPLFIGNNLKIKAPKSKKAGWIVWIQNEYFSPQLVNECWDGEDPLVLEVPDDLPCECGSFQIDICEPKDRIPVQTLFFRYIPFIELEYPKDLILPGEDGHNVEHISVYLNSTDSWQLDLQSNVKGYIEDNKLLVEVTADEDTCQFTINKRGRIETKFEMQVTIPRVRWKTSRQTDWKDKKIELKRDELKPGEKLFLFVKTNDLVNKYNISGILRTDHQEIQEESLTYKEKKYSLFLNKFSESIHKNKNRLSLELEIKKPTGEVIGSIEVLNIPQVEKWRYDYYKDKKFVGDFSTEEIALISSLFEASGKILSYKPILGWYENGELALDRIFKEYIDETLEGKIFSDKSVLDSYPDIVDFNSFERKDFAEFFDNIKKIILHPCVMYFWVYNKIDIPFFPRNKEGLLFYLKFFEGGEKEKLKWIFKEKSYSGEIMDEITYELIKQAHVSLGIKEKLHKFEKGFESPDYREHLFRDDLYDNGMRYLIAKWRFLIKRDGHLGNVFTERDDNFLRRKVIEEANKTKYREYILHPGSLEKTLRLRIDALELTKEDRKKALIDAIEFFKKYWKTEEEKH